ncbi:nitrate reductase molybdenum cofactor assembly chaperone [Acidiphilium sp.]|uniref:nitrate reductase molybdenum cofactor assembly chaperone n=1 Tax=Acidiphilium sp. TaxID=527 RepID=UPI00258BDC89|nr:nitrate reductase molybdenum cofactor assembly chaperone [Acidiphilium sp.]
MRIFKLLSLLLTYPDDALRDAAPDIAHLCRAADALPPNLAERLARLALRIAADDLLDTQERYVALFDQTRSLSLYLFEHVHGESRDRGQAMVDLRAQYEARGLEMAPGELPDFLPLFLEYLDAIPADEALALLGEIRPIAASLAQRLEKRRSDYAAPLAALLALAPEAAADRAPEATADLVPASPDDEPAAARDAAWADAPVRFTAAPSPAACAGDLP